MSTTQRFKFRVWDRCASCWLATPDGLFFKYPHDAIGEYIGDFIRDTDYYLTEQWTGLTDSVGKEIYEGDIVENGNDLGVVCFEQGAFFIDSRKVLRPGEPRFMGTLYWERVLGNIHEHPELLS